MFSPNLSTVTLCPDVLEFTLLRDNDISHTGSRRRRHCSIAHDLVSGVTTEYALIRRTENLRELLDFAYSVFVTYLKTTRSLGWLAARFKGNEWAGA